MCTLSRESQLLFRALPSRKIEQNKLIYLRCDLGIHKKKKQKKGKFMSAASTTKKKVNQNVSFQDGLPLLSSRNQKKKQKVKHNKWILGTFSITSKRRRRRQQQTENWQFRIAIRQSRWSERESKVARKFQREQSQPLQKQQLLQLNHYDTCPLSLSLSLTPRWVESSLNIAGERSAYWCTPHFYCRILTDTHTNTTSTTRKK